MGKLKMASEQTFALRYFASAIDVRPKKKKDKD